MFNMLRPVVQDKELIARLNRRVYSKQSSARFFNERTEKECGMVTQTAVSLGNSEIALILVSSALIFFFTGKKIWRHFTD